ncbi:MAG: hypothetical protein AAFR34_04550 [Pseudomonadota bacterium]
MDATILIGVLMFGTIAAVGIFALTSKARTEKRMDDDDAKKSRLAEDAPNR